MRSALSLSLVCGVLLFAGSSHSEVAPLEASLAPTPIDEPITGTPITPAPGTASTNPPKDPFAPYDPGPASGLWTYSNLSPAERVLADKGRNVTGWTEIHAGFATASAEQAQRAAAAAAAAQLGIASIGDVGVVP